MNVWWRRRSRGLHLFLFIHSLSVHSASCALMSSPRLSLISGQIFTATITASCSDDGSQLDLSGNYQFGFTAECRDVDGSPDAACSVFMDTLDDDKKVVLDVDSSFTDNCDVNLFEVTFAGEMTFYSDEAFTEEADGSDPFVIGQDTIYGKVTVTIPDDTSSEVFEFGDVEIENVYVCTAADGADLSVDADTGLGGCLSPNIDADGPYKVVGNGAVAAYQGTSDFASAENNEAMFSFLTFGLILLSRFGPFFQSFIFMHCLVNDQILRETLSVSTCNCW